MSEEDNFIIQINNTNNENYQFDTKDKTILNSPNFRISFIRKVQPYQQRLKYLYKVYGILSLQLSMTVFFCLLTCTCPSFAKFQMTQQPLLVIALVMSMALSLLLFCFKDLGRIVPYNYIFCFAFILCESYLVSSVCAIYEPKTVLMAAFMTLGITLTLTVYAWQTKNDITIYGGIFYMIAVGLLLMTIFTLFIHIAFLKAIISFVTVIFYGIYLIYDTQLLIGQGRYSLSIDDYILGSIAIYLDIIIIFLKLLQFFGKKK